MDNQCHPYVNEIKKGYIGIVEKVQQTGSDTGIHCNWCACAKLCKLSFANLSLIYHFMSLHTNGFKTAIWSICVYNSFCITVTQQILSDTIIVLHSFYTLPFHTYVQVITSKYCIAYKFLCKFFIVPLHDPIVCTLVLITPTCTLYIYIFFFFVWMLMSFMQPSHAQFCIHTNHVIIFCWMALITITTLSLFHRMCFSFSCIHSMWYTSCAPSQQNSRGLALKPHML